MQRRRFTGFLVIIVILFTIDVALGNGTKSLRPMFVVLANNASAFPTVIPWELIRTKVSRTSSNGFVSTYIK